MLCLWQIAFFQHPLKWDALDITFPWRFFSSESLRSGILPWWNPYQFHGFAHGSIPETWYPPGILLGIFGGYSLYDLSIEYLFHLSIASVGFYRLAQHLGIGRTATILGVVVFPLSGFFIGNAQHTGWIVAGAWMPHVIVAFDRFCQKYRWQDAVEFFLAFFLLISGGYIAYSIIIIYILLTIFLYHLVRNKPTSLSIFFSHWVRFGVIMVGISSVVLVGLWQLKTLIDRGSGLIGDQVIEGSFYFKHLISLIFPYATVHEYPSFWNADQSMISVYVGLPTLCFLGVSLFKLRHKVYRTMWMGTLLFLLLSLGAEVPLRQILNVLPLFDLFRFPSLFRYFFVLGIILIACRVFDDLMQADSNRFRKILKNFSFGILLVSILTLTVLLINSPLLLSELLHLEIKSVTSAIALQSILYIGLYGAFYTCLRYIRSTVSIPTLLIALTVLEVFAATQLTGRVSVFATEDFQPLQSCVDQLPTGFPPAILNDAIGSNGDRSLQNGPLYRNTNTLYKRVGWDGYTPFQYSGFLDLEQSPYYPKNLQRPLIYLSTLVTPSEEAKHYQSYPDILHKDQQISLITFGPNQVTTRISTLAPKLLVLNQNQHPSWHVTIDGLPAAIERVDMNLVGVLVPSGSHTIDFRFEAGSLYNALLISATLFLLLGLIWVKIQFGTRWMIFISVLLVINGGLLFLYTDRSYAFTGIETMRSWIINAVDEIDTDQVDPDVAKITVDRFLDQQDANRLLEWLINAPDTILFWKRTMCLPTANQPESKLLNYYTVVDTFRNGPFEGLVSIRKGRAHLAMESANYFEQPQPYWDKLNQNINSDPNGNQFQDLRGMTFSSTFLVNLSQLRGVLSQVDLKFLARSNQTPNNAKIIYSLQSSEGREYFRKSHTFGSLPNVLSEQWNPVRFTADVPTEIDSDGVLQVYIWNPDTTDLAIDNLEIKLLVDMPTIKE